MSTPDPDPIPAYIAAEIELALAPYRRLLPPEAIEDLRDLMEAFATTHPEMRKMAERLRPDPVVEQSGDPADTDAATRKAAG